MKRFALAMLGIAALCLGGFTTAQAQGIDFSFKNHQTVIATGPFGAGTYKDGYFRIPLKFDDRFAGASTGAYPPLQLAQAKPPTPAAPADDAAKKKAADDAAKKKAAADKAKADAAKKKAAAKPKGPAKATSKAATTAQPAKPPAPAAPPPPAAKREGPVDRGISAVGRGMENVLKGGLCFLRGGPTETRKACGAKG